MNPVGILWFSFFIENSAANKSFKIAVLAIEHAPSRCGNAAKLCGDG